MHLAPPLLSPPTPNSYFCNGSLKSRSYTFISATVNLTLRRPCKLFRFVSMKRVQATAIITRPGKVSKVSDTTDTSPAKLFSSPATGNGNPCHPDRVVLNLLGSLNLFHSPVSDILGYPSVSINHAAILLGRPAKLTSNSSKLAEVPSASFGPPSDNFNRPWVSAGPPSVAAGGPRYRFRPASLFEGCPAKDYEGPAVCEGGLSPIAGGPASNEGRPAEKVRRLASTAARPARLHGRLKPVAGCLKYTAGWLKNTAGRSISRGGGLIPKRNLPSKSAAFLSRLHRYIVLIKTIPP